MSEFTQQPKTKPFHEFGSFRLNSAEKVLLLNGEAVALAPKVFDTLEVFVQNAGRLIEKDELMRKIWQDRFVEEGNLAFNVKELRKALGDSASEPRYIETVPRRGYRFIAEVSEIFEESRKNPPAIKKTPPRRLFVSLAAACILLLGTIAAAPWLVRNKLFYSAPNAPVLAAPFHSEKFSNSGKISQAAISPDGKLIAFTDETGGRYGVWLRHLETAENVQIILPSDDLYFGLAFAHDGQWLYFVRGKKVGADHADIYRVSIFGGVPEKILEHAEGWISLSPDDRQISFVRCQYRNDDFCSLLVADTDGQNERKLLTRPRPVRLTDNQFSPDGKSIAFAAGESFNGGNNFQLTKIDLETGVESEVTPHKFFEIKDLKWLPDGDALLAAAMETLDGKSKIWHIRTATGEVKPLTKDASSYVEISLNKDASRIVSLEVGDNFQLHFSSGGATKILTAAREVVFAPDGRLVYSADDGDIWAINSDGGKQRQLTKNPSKDFEPYVSPDGRFIYFTSNRTGANQIWRMNPDGSDQTEITKTEGGYPVFVSPDGKWIYYESGLHQTLWKVSDDGGQEMEVSNIKLYRPAFSPDGNLIAFFYRDAKKNNQAEIAVMSIADKKIIKVLEFSDQRSSPVKIIWSNDNRTINYVTDDNLKNSLWAQTIDELAQHFVADLGDHEIEQFAFAPDEKSYAYTRGEWFHKAVIIDGFR